MNSDTFKDRLKVAMNGRSNHSFALKCGISEGSLRNYLKGDTSPDLKTLEIISEVSGCNLAWLASGEGELIRVKQVILRGGDFEAGRADGAAARAAHNGLAGFGMEQHAAPGTANGEHTVNEKRVGYQVGPDISWFHEWVDEELRGKSLSEIMAMAVKIKAVLDEGRGK